MLVSPLAFVEPTIPSSVFFDSGYASLCYVFFEPTIPDSDVMYFLM
jgi:hypothetical protein